MTSNKAKEIADDYISSLKDLTINSKPLINMLTMLADDHIEHASAIVEAVENHLQKVPSEIKLPVLYLIDSIVKNVAGAYSNLFTQNIVNTFCGVFEKVDESTRAAMYKLRQTWNEVFPAKKLYSLDVRVQSIDPAWPITAPPPGISSGSIHVNPRFFPRSSQATTTQAPTTTTPTVVPPSDLASEYLKQQKKLLELQKQKVELELLQAKLNFEEQQKQLDEQAAVVKSDLILPSSALVVPSSEPAITKPVAPVLPNQVTKSSKQFVPTASSLLKPVSTANGPRIAPASSMVASMRQHGHQVSRDPRLKSSATTVTSLNAKETLIVDPRLRQQEQQLINQTAAPTTPITVLSDQLKQQVITKKASNVMKQTINNSTIGEGSLKSIINDNNQSSNNKTLNNTCKDNNAHNRSSQKKESRSSSNSIGNLSNNLISTKTNHNQGQLSTISSLLPTTNNSLITTNNTITTTTTTATAITTVATNTSSSSVNKISNSKRDTSRCDKLSSSSSSSSSVSSKSSHRKLGNKTRSKQGLSSPAKISKLERDLSPDSRTITSTKSRDKESSDSSPNSIRTSPQSSSQKNRKKLTSKTKKRSPSPYRIPRRNLDNKSTSSAGGNAVAPGGTVTGSSGLTEEEQSGSLIVSPPHPPAFKDIRQNTRQRNYIRRNKDAQGLSPEHSGLIDNDILIDSASKDEDLRAALPAPNLPVVTGNKEDLDLRILPSNKRQSTDLLEAGSSKKTKSEKFDALFGNEDVDLRTLTNPKAGRPPTPPPPVISGEDTKSGWSKLKTVSKNDDKRDRERKDRPNRSRPYKLSDDQKDRRRGFSSDEDSRPGRRSRDNDKSDRADRNIEIVMKEAEERHREGKITKAEYHKVIQEIWQMNEDQKLRAAQRKDKEIGSLVWEKGIDIGNFTPTDNDMGHRNRNGPRWNQPWQPGPWAHPFGPQGGHFNPEFRPVGPWQNPRFPPIRPDFNQFHNFNSNLGPRMLPLGPNGPMMPGIMANGPIAPMINPVIASMNGPANILLNNGPVPPRNNILSHVPNSANPITVSPSSASPIYEENKTNKDEEIARPGRELPPADPKLLEEIAGDSMKSISIDNTPREIRYYGQTGVVFMAWDDPREIGFQDGIRRILIDDKDTITCAFNEPYKEFIYESDVHKIRLGAPTRELYIDDKWYECYFGGPPITVDIGAKKVSIKLEGPPPQVKIGSIKRTDLVIAKINMIINARNMVPVFLDAKPQIFELDGQHHTLEFTDSLKTVMLNGRPFAVEFGGLPKPIMIGDKKHFIRFSVLPRGVKPGAVRIAGMKGDNPAEGTNELPILKEKSETQTTNSVGFEADSTSQDASDLPSSSKSDMQLEMLSSALSSAMAPSSGLSYEAEPLEKPSAPSAPILPANLNLDELFQRLVETGIVPTLAAAAASAPTTTAPAPSAPVAVTTSIITPTTTAPIIAPIEVKKPEEEAKKEPELPAYLLDKPETLKLPAKIFCGTLYNGKQCGSCSLRFGPEKSVKYNAHLDWHFRQNRRERDSARKAHARSWFYKRSDWAHFETTEEVDDTVRNWFDLEKQNAETENANIDNTPQETLQPSVLTGLDEDDSCAVCHDAFEQFYNEEKEEWHLRPAIKFEDKNYHPLCLEDHKRALAKASLEREMQTTENASHDETTEAEDEKMEEINESIEEPTEIKNDESAEANEGTITEEPSTENKEDNVIADNTEEATEPSSDDVIKSESEQEPAKEFEQEIVDTEMPIVNETVEPMETDIEPMPEEIVKIKEEPVETMETDESTVDFNPVAVKEEPVEPEPEPEPAVPETPTITADTTMAAVTSSIDGNVELKAAPSTLPPPPSKIKINISKPLMSMAKEPEEPKEKSPVNETPVEDNHPAVLVPATIKPSLRGRKLANLPPVAKGHELSGLCSIM